MKIIKTILIALLLMSCSSKGKAEKAIQSADLIISNATVWTANPNQAWAETIVIKNTRIIAVGDSSIVEQYQAKETLDAQGQLVLPGFIDNHTHFMDGANSLVSVDTYGSKTIEEFLGIIKNFAATAPKDEWITGGLWDHEAWGGVASYRIKTGWMKLAPRFQSS